jgi:hypothetical protein
VVYEQLETALADYKEGFKQVSENLNKGYNFLSDRNMERGLCFYFHFTLNQNSGWVKKYLSEGRNYLDDTPKWHYDNCPDQQEILRFLQVRIDVLEKELNLQKCQQENGSQPSLVSLDS